MKSLSHLSTFSLSGLLTLAVSSALAITPTDPLIQEQEDKREYQWGLHTMNFPEAWDYVRGHAYIAMLDTGINMSHPDLQANFRPHLSYDFYNNRHDVDELTPDIRPPFVANDLVGHGTHVAGIIAATTNNGIGGAGTCWHCSLMVGKISYPVRASVTDNTGATWTGYRPTIDKASFARSLNAAVASGAQVINMSLGQYGFNCGDNHSDPLCQAIEYAAEKDVIMVGAAGNDWSKHSHQYPATDHRVIKVHAVKPSLMPTEWTYTYGLRFDLGAPGLNIVSTFYPNIDYFPASIEHTQAIKCRDSLSAPPGYGPCDGTSMAAPHVSGLAGLLRSANPLLLSDQIRRIINNHVLETPSPVNSSNPGHGVPNALESVKAVMGEARGQTMRNRLTPLFSLYSEAGGDHFYTTSPQMAMAALHEKLHPQPAAGLINWRSEGGSVTPGYPEFLRDPEASTHQPQAAAYIFTTYQNPYRSSHSLSPLYRLSYQGDYTGNNPLNVDHVYTTSKTEVSNFQQAGYKLDGIEGYIFPRGMEQPIGTVKLYRKYNPDQDDHAIFPETMLSEMISAGYSMNDGLDWIGYVYLNEDTDQDGLIDGFERIIGTDINNQDSDDDGISDGIEVNNYPYSDPLTGVDRSLIL
jgi:hypothetical protein